jgi:hypothetical protein
MIASRARRTAMRHLLRLLALLLLAAAPAIAWEHWGGDRGGSRFSQLDQITLKNVGNLVRAFEFRTGDLDARAPEVMKRTKFEATPLFVEDSLIFCSPFNEVIALDPGTGAPKWRYDPKISTDRRPANRYNCRGVTYWIDDAAPVNAACRARIFMGTNDVRLIVAASRRAMPMSGRRCRSTKSAAWCFCRHRRRARISGAASVPATTSMPIPWSRCAPRPANSCGRSRPCIMTSGTMTCRRSRRWRASIPAMASATS